MAISTSSFNIRICDNELSLFEFLSKTLEIHIREERYQSLYVRFVLNLLIGSAGLQSTGQRHKIQNTEFQFRCNFNCKSSMLSFISDERKLIFWL